MLLKLSFTKSADSTFLTTKDSNSNTLKMFEFNKEFKNDDPFSYIYAIKDSMIDLINLNTEEVHRSLTCNCNPIIIPVEDDSESILVFLRVDEVVANALTCSLKGDSKFVPIDMLSLEDLHKYRAKEVLNYNEAKRRNT